MHLALFFQNASRSIARLSVWNIASSISPRSHKMAKPFSEMLVGTFFLRIRLTCHVAKSRSMNNCSSNPSKSITVADATAGSSGSLGGCCSRITIRFSLRATLRTVRFFGLLERPKVKSEGAA